MTWHAPAIDAGPGHESRGGLSYAFGDPQAGHGFLPGAFLLCCRQHWPEGAPAGFRDEPPTYVEDLPGQQTVSVPQAREH